MDRFMYESQNLPDSFVATLKVASQISVPMKMIVREIISCPATIDDMATVAKVTRIASSKASEKRMLDGIEIASLVNNLTKQPEIGPEASDEDGLASEKIGITPRRLWIEWLKNISVTMRAFLRASDVYNVIEGDAVTLRSGDAAYFYGERGEKQVWVSKTPDTLKKYIQNKFPGKSIEVNGIEIIVDAPPGPESKPSEARVFKAGEKGNQPFPEPVYLKRDLSGDISLAGSAKPLFPDQFTVSSLVEWQGISVRVFSWMNGPKNKAASKFFGVTMKGPIVLAVPEFRHNQKWAL